MEIAGICSICGRVARKLISCRLCGKIVCEACQIGGICKDCYAGKRASKKWEYEKGSGLP